MIVIYLVAGWCAGYALGGTHLWGLLGALFVLAAWRLVAGKSRSPRPEIGQPATVNLPEAQCLPYGAAKPPVSTKVLWVETPLGALDTEQQRLLQLLSGTRHGAILVTGPAGSGKSTLLRAFSSSVQNRVILAPTGIAALNIGGQTIHSFFRFPPRLVRFRDDRDIRTFRPGSVQRKLFQAVEYLVIDEISMVRADLMDAMDWSLRKNRRFDHPFGGVRVVMFGDVMQLEPVVEDEKESEYIRTTWGSPFFFDARVWKEIPLVPVRLTRVYRQQKDPEFLEFLRNLRQGNASCIEALNQCVRPDGGLRDGVVILCPRRREADAINHRKLAALPGPAVEYESRVYGDFSEDELPTDRRLVLKNGAQVILLRNSDEYVNGDIGWVENLSPDAAVVRLRRGPFVTVVPAKWEKVRYDYDPEKQEIVPRVVGTFVQLPIRLAWALTIHKSQGLTLDEVHIEMGRGMFAHGQLYVALTRARSRQGLTLSRPIRESDVIWHPRALAFESWLERQG